MPRSILIRYEVDSHAGKLVFVDSANIFSGGVQQFMDRPIMAGEVDDKRFADLVRDPFIIQEEFYIEEIPRMLTVQSSAEFSSIKVRQRESLRSDR